MAPTFQYIPVADIALDDETHMMTYRPQMGALRHSVTRAGVLMPLHLRRLSERVQLQVVCGFKRLRICQEAGHTSVPALVYRAAELPAERALLLALHDNLGCRELNPVEKARVLWRLQHDFGYQRPTLIEEFCPLLGLPPRATTLEAYYALANLDDALQAATVEGVLPLETALWIGRHTATDAQALVELFTGLKLGTNRAREFATWIDDVCRRDDCSAAWLLHHLGVGQLLADATLAGPPRVEKIRRCLRQAANDSFADELRRHSPPPIDQDAWSATMSSIDALIAQAEDSCYCSTASCDKASEALDEVRTLVYDFDSLASGSATGWSNPGTRQETIQRLLRNAESLIEP